MNIEKRFLDYVSIDTQSDDSSTTPSTSKQLDLAKILVEHMKELNMINVELDEYGIVYGTYPSNGGNKDVIGLIAHMDTSPDCSGKNIVTKKICNYNGQTIIINKDKNLTIDPNEYTELKKMIGHDIITTDGNTLLGADDKAGIAVILDAIQYLNEHPEIKHNDIQVAFTPDEEVGRGADNFNVKRFNAQYAYTLDGDSVDVYNYENFNAYSVHIEINGRSIHPGSAKNKMVNASSIALEFDSMLPKQMRPEYTDGYDGFYHLHSINGTCEHASLDYIIRNHDLSKAKKQLSTITNIIYYLNKKYNYDLVTATINESYLNMAELIKDNYFVIERLLEAYKKTGIKPICEPIRGGTDGARLTFMNLPCPNIGVGGGNFHGPLEYVSLTMMKQASNLVINLIQE